MTVESAGITKNTHLILENMMVRQHQFLYSDMTVTVDWVVKIYYLAIHPSQFKKQQFLK